MSKIIHFLRKHATRARNWISNHPVMGGGIVTVIVLMAVQISFGLASYRENAAQLARLDGMPATTLSSVIEQADRGQVARVMTHVVQEGGWSTPRLRRYMEVVDRKGVHTKLESQTLMGEEFDKRMTQAAIKNAIVFERGFDAGGANRITDTVQMLLVLAVIVLVLLAAQMLVGETLAGHSFKPQSKDDTVTLDDIIGYAEVKREILEIMDHLTNAEAYAKHGVRAPRGLLMTGDPGVGKTMLAKAMSNVLKAELFYCTGADFAEMYVGVGPRRVRALFRRARQAKRAIIFIDEIDALGSRASMGNDSERLGTLNQMLSEMDGINSNGQVLVVGATNFADRLDPALVRPGRFDKKLHIPLPDRTTRRALMQHKLQGARLDPAIDFEALADRTEGYSGAQLVSLIDEARNLALRGVGGQSNSRPPLVSQEILERAQEVAILGVSENKLNPEDARRAGLHELGHALMGFLRCPDSFVEKVTINGRGSAAGYTIQRPVGERKLRTEPVLRGELAMLLGGRAAEQVLLGAVSSGASDDLRRANTLAREMVCFLGMGPSTGLLSFLEAGQIGATIPKRMEDDIAALLNSIYAETMAVMVANRQWLLDRGEELVRLGLLGHAAMFVANPPIDTVQS